MAGFWKYCITSISFVPLLMHGKQKKKKKKIVPSTFNKDEHMAPCQFQIFSPWIANRKQLAKDIKPIHDSFSFP